MADDTMTEEELNAIDNPEADKTGDPAADDKTGDPPPDDKTGDPPPDDKTGEPDVSWRDSIKDENARKQADRFNTVEDLAKANYTLRQKISKNLVIPGEDADDVEVAHFREQLGVPKTARDYEFPAFEEGGDTPEAVASQDKWKGIFHDNNVPKEVAKNIIEAYRKDAEAQAEQQVKDDKDYAEAGDQALRDKWGKEYDTNRALANRAVDQLFGESLEDVRQIQGEDGKFILDHPAFVEVFATVAREMSEGSLGENFLSDTQKEGFQAQADDFRVKAKEAQAAGNATEANRWSEKEREALGKLSGTAPLVGMEGRQL